MYVSHSYGQPPLPGERLKAQQAVAEIGAPGRVLDGDYILHTPIPHTDSVIHNDAGNVSHDIYAANLDSISPGGSWWIPDYPASLDPEYFMEIFYLQNVPDEFEPMTQPWVPGYPIHTVVEYAVEIRPLDYRGDCNDDGVINIADLICMVNYLFLGVPPSASLSELDTNCDGVANIADVITVINYLFLGTPTPRCCDP